MEAALKATLEQGQEQLEQQDWPLPCPQGLSQCMAHGRSKCLVVENVNGVCEETVPISTPTLSMDHCADRVSTDCYNLQQTAAAAPQKVLARVHIRNTRTPGHRGTKSLE